MRGPWENSGTLLAGAGILASQDCTRPAWCRQSPTDSPPFLSRDGPCSQSVGDCPMWPVQSTHVLPTSPAQMRRPNPGATHLLSVPLWKKF